MVIAQQQEQYHDGLSRVWVCAWGTVQYLTLWWQRADVGDKLGTQTRSNQRELRKSVLKATEAGIPK